jgi:hypothetical protein
MKKIILILISAFLLGVFSQNLYHSMVTGLNPIMVVILALILVSCFILEIIYLNKNTVKKNIIFLAIVMNLLFIGGFIYLDNQQIQGKSKNYFSFTSFTT